MRIITYILMFFTLSLTSCRTLDGNDTTTKPNVPASHDSQNRANETDATKKKVESVRDTVGDIKNKVIDSTGKIKIKDTTGIMKNDVVDIENEMVRQEKLKDELNVVVDELNQHRGALIVDKEKIKSLEDTIVAKDKQITTITEKNKEEIDKLNKSLEISNSKYMRLLIILSTVLIALSGAMFFNKPSKESLSIGVGGLVLLVVSLSVQHFSVKYAYVGFGAIVVGVVFIIWKVIEFNRKEKETEELKEDFKEVVETVELAKEKILPEDKKLLFGTVHSDGLAGTIQTKRTKARVFEARKWINEKNRPTMDSKN